MTDYHPVTKEELEQLMSWSTHKSPDVCLYERRMEILRKVATRPDPLEVLEKWRATQINSYEGLWKMETSFITELRTNPDAVIARGKSEGWIE
jgi:hypothetical protein